MASNYVMESAGKAERTHELVFAGDGVRLSGQIDYPSFASPASGVYPLMFILHHSGCNTRQAYEHYVRAALSCGYAVFRWDKRGTGRSGASGRGSTTQDAVNAYETALEQERIDRHNVVILAQGEGTLLLGEAFGLFARLQRPRGVVLAGNMLDPKAILAIEASVQIILGDEDWKDPRIFARDAADAHNAAYNFGASFYVARHANRRLLINQDGEEQFHVGARRFMRDWLLSLCQASV